ncbi:MAG: AMP-binding protein [Rhizobiales bacterium]|nr:AMP-binding protein [Hyphomicrobiales bacterium]
MTGAPLPARFNLARHCLARAAAATPDKVALIVVSDVAAPIEAAERWTYAALDEAVRRVAAGLLAEGFRPGDRLVMRLPNDSDYALVFLGALAAGIVPIPLSTQLTEPEVAFLVADADAAAIVQPSAEGVGAGRRRIIDAAALRRMKSVAPLAAYADTAGEDPAYMIYTSGTSGRPKGVVHAHRVALGRAPMHADWEGIGPDDVMLHAGAFNWSYTLGVGLIDPWSVGATAVLYNGEKDPAVWPRLMAISHASHFAAVPSLYRQILKYARPARGDIPALRRCLAAGEALSPAVLSDWRDATGLAIHEAFGMSECSTFVSNREGLPIRPGSPGKPQRGRRISVISEGDDPVELPPGEVGLLAIHRSDPGLMLGYWSRPDEDARVYRGEWFAGGDLAAFDADGYLWHHGRADDVMNAGGYRVSPLEVEAALADCPGISEVAVAEIRPRPDVSIVAAFIVRQPGSAMDSQAILAHAETRLAAYKRPREVVFVDALPRSRNGKLIRRALAGFVPKS